MIPSEFMTLVQDPAFLAFLQGILTNATWDLTKASARGIGKLLSREQFGEEAFQGLRADERIVRTCQLIVNAAIQGLDEPSRLQVSHDADFG